MTTLEYGDKLRTEEEHSKRWYIMGYVWNRCETVLASALTLEEALEAGKELSKTHGRVYVIKYAESIKKVRQEKYIVNAFYKDGAEVEGWLK